MIDPKIEVSLDPQPKGTCSSGSLSSAQTGSHIDCRDRSVAQTIPVVGTDFSLHYASRETAGSAPANSNLGLFIAPTDLPDMYGKIIKIDATLSVGGRSLTKSYDINAPSLLQSLSPTFEWDGTDSNGNPLNGTQLGEATVTFHMERGPMGQSNVQLYRKIPAYIGRSDQLDRFGLGGWSLSAYHQFDKSTKMLFLGMGARTPIEDPKSTATYVPNAQGVINVPSIDTSEIYQFDENGLHLATYDSLTGAKIYTFSHDSAGLLLSIQDRAGNSTTIQRDGSGRFSGITSPYGRVTTISLDPSGYIASITNPRSETTQFTYHSGSQTGLMATFTNAKGRTKSYSYDSSGYLVSATDFKGNVKDITFYSEINPSNGSHTSRTFFSSPLGRMTIYETSASSMTNTYPDGSREQLTVSPDGYVKDFVDTTGTSYRMEYKADPRFAERFYLTKSTVHIPQTSNTVYNRSYIQSDPGDPLSLESFQTEVEKEGLGLFRKTYTRSTNTLLTTTPSGRTITESFNSLGLTSSLRIGNKAPWRFIYDPRGRISKVKRSTRVSSYKYNARGLVASYTDALGQVTKYTYTLADRLKTITLPNSKVITFHYDRNGNLNWLLPPNEQLYRYTFDKKDLPVTNLEPIVAGATTQWNWSYSADDELTRVIHPDLSLLNYSYDSYGRLSSVSGPNILKTYNYNYRGQIASIQSQNNDLLSFQYIGRYPTKYEWSGSVNGTVGFTWGSHDRIASVSVNGQPVADYQFTPEGEVAVVNNLSVVRSPSTGFITSTKVRSVRAKFTYNSFGESVTELNTLGGVDFLESNYTRDGLGRIIGISRVADGVTTNKTFTFDSIGQLLSETTDGVVTSAFSYDANGNRFTSGGNEVYDEHDRLISNSEWMFTYSRNGFLTKKTHRISEESIDYLYDNLGNLLQVRQENGAVVEYVVDGLDRRIQRKVSNAFTDAFIYQDKLKPIAQLNEDGSVRATFIYGTKYNSPDLIVKNGITYRVIHDHLGSPIFIVDTRNNEVVQKMTFDTWGKVLEDTNPGFQPFGFAGGLYDSTTGLLRFGARDYDPSIGRWLNKDPITFDGGWNLYAYSNNDPVNFIDPDGLRPDDPAFWPAPQGAIEPAPEGVAIGAAAGIVGGAAVMCAGEALGVATASRAITPAADAILKYIGPGGKLIRNKAGDIVLMSKDGLKKVRFDIKRPQPHNNPHSHVEEIINGTWHKSGPIYPKNVPPN
ncbi:RHS repeat domain-containing protein [Oligoflexus tunisiensis]|uniref:RHS repeat domain-containing protein n=1 Tax=Oligoflexus tunisiensis TaxID=708132 RepID=UPI000A5072DA|nr:RHS repeat-associated core domain-containing protein [Oligoflexus tunisiensis]